MARRPWGTLDLVQGHALGTADEESCLTSAEVTCPPRRGALECAPADFSAQPLSAQDTPPILLEAPVLGLGSVATVLRAWYPDRQPWHPWQVA